MQDRYEPLKARALAALQLDDANGDRGDVAPPATDMPRSMASRCLSCGKDMSVRDLKAGGSHCQEHKEKAGDELRSPAPHLVPRPGGSTTKPRLPMEKDGGDGEPTALGGPGSGPHPGLGQRLKAVVKSAAHAIAKQYHVPKVDSKGDRPEDRGTRGPINDIAKHRDPWD